MKKSHLLWGVAMVFCLGSFAQQEAGIVFKTGSFAEAKAAAATQGKLVFVDCYTSWCAPCKWMDKNVFVQDSVSNFFNAHFINFRIDMEKGEGPELKNLYDVASYPTYLFVNEKGGLVHRTASRMEAEAFLAEGRRALDSSASYTVLRNRYEAGERNTALLLDYALVMQHVDRKEADRLVRELEGSITDIELHSPFGWQVISALAQNETGRLGKYLLANKAYFVSVAGNSAVDDVCNRIALYAMYGIIREHNSQLFFTRLQHMQQSSDKLVQRNAAMLEMEYFVEMNRTDSFITASDRAMEGILAFEDADLSFIARRAQRSGAPGQEMLLQCLKLARRAAELNPEEYSNQSTLGAICLDLQRKEEGLQAARKARLLADASTSKIQKLADDLVAKLEAL